MAQALLITTPLKKFLSQSDSLNISGIDSARNLIEQTKCEITSLLSGFSKNLEILNRSHAAVVSAISIVEEAGGLTVRARNYVTPPTDPLKFSDKIREIEDQFLAVLDKLDVHINQSNIEGVNLMKGDELITVFDLNGQNSLKTQGFPLTSDVLGFRKPNFHTVMNVQYSRIDVMNAMDLFVTLRNMIAGDIVLLKNRMAFASEAIEATVLNPVHLKTFMTVQESVPLFKIQHESFLGDEETSLAQDSQSSVLQFFTEDTSHHDIKKKD